MDLVYPELNCLNATAMKPWIYSKSSLHILVNKTGLFERCVDLTKLARDVSRSVGKLSCHYYGDRPEDEFLKKENLKQIEQK